MCVAIREMELQLVSKLALKSSASKASDDPSWRLGGWSAVSQSMKIGLHQEAYRTTIKGRQTTLKYP